MFFKLSPLQNQEYKRPVSQSCQKKIKMTSSLSKKKSRLVASNQSKNVRIYQDPIIINPTAAAVAAMTVIMRNKGVVRISAVLAKIYRWIYFWLDILNEESEQTKFHRLMKVCCQYVRATTIRQVS